MWLSKTTNEDINLLTNEQITEIVFGNTGDGGECADVALLLGSRPAYAKERAEAAAKLYLAGRVKHIIPSGGVLWDVDGKKVSEARFMADVMLSMGVPEDAIILEEEATTTKENMIFGTLQINRHLKIQFTKSCMIVTSASHLRRSLALAKLYLPRSIKIYGCPATNERTVTDAARREIPLLKGLIGYGLIDDIEY